MDQRNLARKGRSARRAAALILLLAGSAAASGVYTWRDADGRLHFGDAPPETEQAQDLSRQYDYRPPFSIVIEGIDYAVSPRLHNRISTSVRKIFAIYRQALEIEYPEETEFRIVIYGTKDAYRAYQQRVAPALRHSDGFYNAASNRITTWGMAEPYLVPLIIHEVSHAISASHGRYIPTWLNEGLAEYFEAMDVSGLSASVPVQSHWLRDLRGRGWHRHAPDLRARLDVAHEDWYAASGSSHVGYALSWSVVYFLMDSAPGRQLVRQLLALPHSPDRPDSMAFIAARWPGGLPAFTEAWREWLAGADGRHRY